MERKRPDLHYKNGRILSSSGMTPCAREHPEAVPIHSMTLKV
jgi:hypothetical protein